MKPTPMEEGPRAYENFRGLLTKLAAVPKSELPKPDKAKPTPKAATRRAKRSG